MKKTILYMVIFLLPCISKADEFPWVRKILSKGSTVWVLVSQNATPDSILYKIDFDESGKIYWGEEKNYTLFENVNNENEKILKRTCLIIDSLNAVNKTDGRKPDILNNNWWSIEQDWSTIERRATSFLCYRTSDVWKTKMYQFPTNNLSVLHAERGSKHRVWAGGFYFIGYYYNETFTRLFFIDNYALQGTSVYLCEEGEDCGKEPEPQEEDYESIEKYNEAFQDYEVSMYGDGYPQFACFCDGRKIGHVQDEDGYVNFREKPDIHSSVIGIILNRVRVFYWEDENNPNWYRVEIDDVTGYVHKSRIREGEYQPESSANE